MPALRSSVSVTTPKVSGSVATTSISQLAVRPFVCESYEMQETLYQPMRAAAVLVFGPALLWGATKISPQHGVARVLSLTAGMWLIGYNMLRHYEIRSEVQRYMESQGNT